jgi:phosphoribosylamine--glycine ligase
MKLLIIGGGGREHALTWKLLRDVPGATAIAAPGNPGIAQLARCVNVKADDVAGLLALARAERPDITVVGPEAPLAAGIVDRFRAEGFAIFGPTRDAARIETSKRFAKELMLRAGVPTARATHHTSADSAKHAAAELASAGAPVVIKASGLAAGKGVIIAHSLADANAAIDAMLLDGAFGSAGDEILVEEFMEGEELSIFALCDGERALMMLGAQDHKRLRDGDRGPNTGGMGAYCPVSIDSDAIREIVHTQVFAPTLKALRDEGCPFTGLLYAGLMLTQDGPKVVEFNCRFGDPETQALLPLMEGPLFPAIAAVARGQSLDDVEPLAWYDAASITTVLAAEGYPDKAATGDVITFPPPEDGVVVFHAGTASANGHVVTAGGRVLAVTAVAPLLDAAARRSQAYAEQIEFRGKQFRHDIGWRELRRNAGVA